MPAGPRSSARDRPSQDHFWRSQPPPAARPYTSNHGWAIAVDIGGRRAAAWMMRNGHRFGWSWDEGRRVGEWWHFRYVGVSKARLRQLAAGADPLRGLGEKQTQAAQRLLYHRRLREQEKLSGRGPKYEQQDRYAAGWKRKLEDYRRHATRKQRKIIDRVLRATDGNL